jgi:hypothetical protein
MNIEAPALCANACVKEVLMDKRLEQLFFMVSENIIE